MNDLRTLTLAAAIGRRREQEERAAVEAARDREFAALVGLAQAQCRAAFEGLRYSRPALPSDGRDLNYVPKVEGPIAVEPMSDGVTVRCGKLGVQLATLRIERGQYPPDRTNGASARVALFDGRRWEQHSHPGVVTALAALAEEIGRHVDPGSGCDRPALALDVYRSVVGSTESLEHDDHVGPDLAYLLGAILEGTSCEWPEDRPIVRWLRHHYPEPTHPVWRHVEIEKEEVDV